MINTFNQFLDVIRVTGLAPPDTIEPGKLYRFPGVGKRKYNTAGWCILFDDGLGGCFGDWSSGLSENWQAKNNKIYTASERSAFKLYVADARAMAKKERQAKQDAAASRATHIWNSATPLHYDNPYLKLKGIDEACDCLFNDYVVKQINDVIVLPIHDFYGHLSSLLFIKPDGSKRFLTGGRKSDCVIHIQNELIAAPQSFPHQVIICEGWATGCTLAYKNPYATVLAAIDAGNLVSVALSVSNTWEATTLIIAGDDDRLTPGNPGATKAREAAAATGALLALPQWPADAPNTLTDFNDLDTWLNQDSSKGMTF